MTRLKMTVAGLAIVFAGWCTAAAQEPTFQELLDQLLPGMGAEKIPDRQGPQQQFQDACFKLGTPGKEAERASACKLMAEKLGPDAAAKPARVWLLKQLEFIGRAECVDAVAAQLGDKDAEIRDWARRALQNNPAPEANAKLLAALHAGGDTNRRVGLINSLGFRGDQASVSSLAKQLEDKDPAIVAAAANALGKIGALEALKPALFGRDVKAPTTARIDAINAHLAKMPPALCNQIADAYLRCVAQLVKQGKGGEAAAIYRSLEPLKLRRPGRLAVLEGILETAGNQAVPTVLRMLAGNDKDARQIAAGFIGQISGQAAMQALAAGFSKLPPDGQFLLVSALAAKGDKAAMPAAIAATTSDNAEVKLAGFRALAKLGNASVVPLLIETMLAGTDASGPARESLHQVYGPGVDEAVLAAMQAEKDSGKRGTLIDVLDARRSVVAVPALLKEAQNEDAGIRGKAVRALGDMGEPGNVRAMISMLLKAPKGRERDQIDRAIWFICKRIGDADGRAEPVLAALAGASEADRCILLPLLGRIGGKKALQAIEPALSSSNAELQDAAVRALCNWPNAAVADRLLKMAETSTSENHRIWALRAYVRVITLRESHPNQQTLQKLGKAMKLATRDDERKLILSRVSALRYVESLRWVVPYLDNPALVNQAARAVVELAHHRGLVEPNHAEFMAALKKVTQVCKDKGIVDRAKRYMEGL